MKKGIVLALFALVASMSYAQIGWNVKAGANFSNFSNLDGSKAKLGFQAGVGLEYAISDQFFVQPSLMFVTKGAKLGEAKSNPMYIELPIMAATRFEIADEQNVVLKAGPYVAYGVAGKTKVGSISTDFFKKSSDEVWGANRFDAGVGVGVAYEYSNYFVELNGGLGLTKIHKAGKSKNMTFGLNLGYKF